MDSVTLTVLIAFLAMIVFSIIVAVRPDASRRDGRRHRGAP